MFKKFKKLLRTVLEKIGLIDKPEMGVVEPPVIPPVADPVKKLLDENKGVSYDLDKILGRQETKDNPSVDKEKDEEPNEWILEMAYKKELAEIEASLEAERLRDEREEEIRKNSGALPPDLYKDARKELQETMAKIKREAELKSKLSAISILKKYQTEDCISLDKNSEGCLFRALRKEPIKYEEVEAALKLCISVNALNADGQTALDLLPKIPVTDSEKRLARLMNKYGAKRSLDKEENKTDTNEIGGIDLIKLRDDLRKFYPDLFDPTPTPNPDPHPFDPNPIPMPNPVPMPKPYPLDIDPIIDPTPHPFDPIPKPVPMPNPYWLEPVGPGGIDPKWKVIDGLPEPKPDAYKKLKDHMKQKYGLDFEGDLISPAKDKDVTATLLATKGSRE